METREGIVKELYEENGVWWSRIEVLVPAGIRTAEILLPGKEEWFDFPIRKGDPQEEESYELFGQPWTTKPPLKVGDAVKIRFT
jgi:hypothetical protein